MRQITSPNITQLKYVRPQKLIGTIPPQPLTLLNLPTPNTAALSTDCYLGNSHFLSNISFNGQAKIYFLC